MKTKQEAKERPFVADPKTSLRIVRGRRTQMRSLIHWRPYEGGINLGFSGLQPGLYNTCNPDSGWVLRSRDGRGTWNDRTKPVNCPFGLVGDRLWLQEDYRALGSSGDREDVEYRADGAKRACKTDEIVIHSAEWLSAKDMPRWATRAILQIEKIEVQRLQEISDEDIVAEAVACEHCDGRGWYLERFADNHGTPCKYCLEEARKRGIDIAPGQYAKQDLRNVFAESWNSRYDKRAHWEKNPWVWVVTWKLKEV